MQRFTLTHLTAGGWTQPFGSIIKQSKLPNHTGLKVEMFLSTEQQWGVCPPFFTNSTPRHTCALPRAFTPRYETPNSASPVGIKRCSTVWYEKSNRSPGPTGAPLRAACTRGAGQLTAGSRCLQEVLGNKALSRKQILDRLSSPYKWAVSFLRVWNQTALEVLFYPKINLKLQTAADIFVSEEALSGFQEQISSDLLFLKWCLIQDVWGRPVNGPN